MKVIVDITVAAFMNVAEIRYRYFQNLPQSLSIKSSARGEDHCSLSAMFTKSIWR
jgi:hypothetical protein